MGLGRFWSLERGGKMCVCVCIYRQWKRGRGGGGVYDIVVV